MLIEKECAICQKKYSSVYLQRIRVGAVDARKYVWVHPLCALTHDACELMDFREMEWVMTPDTPLYP